MEIAEIYHFYTKTCESGIKIFLSYVYVKPACDEFVDAVASKQIAASWIATRYSHKGTFQ